MLCAFVGFGIKASNEGFGEDDEDYKVGCMYLKISKKLLLLVIVFFLLTVFIPEKKTLIEMFVAKIATIENCELTLDGIKYVLDYIVIKMTEIKWYATLYNYTRIAYCACGCLRMAILDTDNKEWREQS